MKQVLITGAHGFLGRHCAREFAAHGWRVTGLDICAWQGERPQDYGIATGQVAAITPQSLAALEIAPAAVVHCAGSGSVGFSLAQPLDDFRMTVETTAVLLDYLRTVAPQARLIYPSSAAVYGCCAAGPIGEATLPAPVSPYGVHKRLAEELCVSSARSFGLEVSLVRFFSLYGAGLRKQLLWDASRRLASAAAGETVEFFGSGTETRDWLHVRDAARLMRLLAEAPQAGLLVNGGSGAGVTVRTALTLLAEKLAAGATLAFNGSEREGDPRHLQADIDQALTLGWTPQTTLADGLAEYAAWFRKEVA